MQKGNREVSESVYIEPATGRIYPVNDSPFQRVDLIWNSKNLWVNMQQCPANDVILDDLNDSRYFEYVMAAPPTAAELFVPSV